MDQREIFLRHLGQTSANPLGLEIVRAEGSYLYDIGGKAFLDLIGGISVANTGHRHPAVLAAIREQLDAYLHIMVYGEFIQSPQVKYAAALVAQLPPSLNSVYFTNSGAEAVEGAMKLAKRLTNRRQIIAFDHAYHGSTQGALSLMGSEYFRNSFRPLLSGIDHYSFNSIDSLDKITEQTAMVIVETIQGEAGIRIPSLHWMQSLREKCTATGCLLVLDEIQTGFGRTGHRWGFEQFGIVPDILLLGKALGGGMPLGAFIAGQSLMNALTHHPELGHITTFGGHPVSCAAGLASLNVLLEEKLIAGIEAKSRLFESLLTHSRIKAIRSAGLLIAVEFETAEINQQIIHRCIASGLLTDWFLFAPHCLRICPPLTINEAEIRNACALILQACDNG